MYSIDFEQCQMDYRDTERPNFSLHHSFNCFQGNGAGTCSGDGGSPLVCPIPNSDKYMQVSIYSNNYVSICSLRCLLNLILNIPPCLHDQVLYFRQELHLGEIMIVMEINQMFLEMYQRRQDLLTGLQSVLKGWTLIFLGCKDMKDGPKDNIVITWMKLMI